MKVNSIKDAQDLLLKYLEDKWKYSPSFKSNLPKVIEEKTLKYPWGWLFFYDSKRFLEEGDDEFAYMGNVPLFVDKIDGTIHPMWSPTVKTNELLDKYFIEKGYISQGPIM